MYNRLVDTQSSYRAAAFLGNVPWLGSYLGQIPALVRPLHTFVTHGKNAMVKRMARGSTIRDLFHHLVSNALLRSTVSPV